MNPASLDDLRAAYARCRARNSAASYEAGSLIEALEARITELEALVDPALDTAIERLRHATRPGKMHDA